jgi:hypothetical protein
LYVQLGAVTLLVLLVAILGVSIAAIVGGSSRHFTHYDNYNESPRMPPFELK